MHQLPTSSRHLIPHRDPAGPTWWQMYVPLWKNRCTFSIGVEKHRHHSTTSVNLTSRSFGNIIPIPAGNIRWTCWPEIATLRSHDLPGSASKEDERAKLETWRHLYGASNSYSTPIFLIRHVKRYHALFVCENYVKLRLFFSEGVPYQTHHGLGANFSWLEATGRLSGDNWIILYTSYTNSLEVKLPFLHRLVYDPPFLCKSGDLSSSNMEAPFSRYPWLPKSFPTWIYPPHHPGFQSRFQDYYILT